ncbi:hypothetical protein F2Q69_00009962 [Brassica cretica]|uniref:WRKY domain-containing protein n=1 Tax=Brassica cretica TaxID=69181 RepID=A0A8S9PL13_BRACR|nr:hypothetical protein F2Q69_00009962 [Brassica cretica]
MVSNIIGVTRPKNKTQSVITQVESVEDHPDDGFRWRKYGQKVVTGNANPRSYYRCTYTGCEVKKLVEKSVDNVKLVVATYDGIHEHVPPPERISKSSTKNQSGSSMSQDPSMQNKEKTELFVGGLNQAETTDLRSLGFTPGSMPIRYLGLPLMHRKLRISEYRPLLVKISGQFTAWSCKKLSYAGHAQLINSVIYGTINFWTSAFILPKGCLQQIQSLCSRFLWTGNITDRGVAKIAWSTICLPKREGGLGFRNLEIWNKTLCLKLGSTSSNGDPLLHSLQVC